MLAKATRLREHRSTKSVRQETECGRKCSRDVATNANARSQSLTAQYLSGRKIDPNSEIAPEVFARDQDRRRARKQSQENRCRNSARHFHLRDRRLRFREIDAHSRRSLSEFDARARRIERSGTGRMQKRDRRASRGRHRDGRSIATRAHATLDADSLSRSLRSRARTFRRAAGSDVTGTDRERVLVQLRQRTLRTLLRHRLSRKSRCSF